MKKKAIPAPKENSRKNAVLKSLAGSVLLIALGVLLLLRPDFATTALASVLGWILIGGGAILITVTVLNWRVMGPLELAVGILAAAAGIFIVIKPNFLASAFGIIIGIYVGFNGVVALLNSLSLYKAGRNALANLILGLILVAIAAVLIFVPLSLSNLLFRIVGGFMVVSGLVNLVLRSRFFLDPPKKQAVVEAREDR